MIIWLGIIIIIIMMTVTIATVTWVAEMPSQGYVMIVSDQTKAGHSQFATLGNS